LFHPTVPRIPLVAPYRPDFGDIPLLGFDYGNDPTFRPVVMAAAGRLVARIHRPPPRVHGVVEQWMPTSFPKLKALFLDHAPAGQPRALRRRRP